MAVTKISPIERLMSKAKLNEETGCWEWTGAKDEKGYGLFQLDATRRAHRISYQFFKGEITEGLTLDHLCRVRGCINPAHLEAVTNRENCRRGLLGSKLNRTHCDQGHQFTPENTRIRERERRSPGRECRECARIRAREWYLAHVASNRTNSCN